MKNPHKNNRSWKIVVFRRHYLSSRAAEVDKISKIWPQLLVPTQNVAHVVLFLDQFTTGYPRLVQMYADHFSYEFLRLRTKGLKATNCFSIITLMIIREKKIIEQFPTPKTSTNLAAILKTASLQCNNHRLVTIAGWSEVPSQS